MTDNSISIQGNSEHDVIIAGDNNVAGNGNIVININKSGDSVPKSDSEIEEYCKKAVSLHEKIHLAGFKTRLRVPILIEDIYVPLRAMVDLRPIGNACFADSEDAEKHLERCGDEISIPDAFLKAEKMGRHGIVILGDPGSGKTTHLKRVLLWIFQKNYIGLPENMIPVFLPLRELRDLNRSLDVFIQQQLDLPHLGTPLGFGKRLLQRGNLLFLLDGLDEVADSQQRVRVSRWIEDAMRIYHNCRFVVTSRFAGYTDEARLNEEFIEMHIRPLSPEQAEAFIRNWYRIVETGTSKDSEQAEIVADQKAKDLTERLRQPEFRARRVFEMTRNPLLLTNLCLVHLDRGNLPHSRASLYEECTDVLLERWRSAVGIKTRITAKMGRRVLQPAALWLHQKHNRIRAKAAELAPIIEPALKAVGWSHGAADEFLKAVRDESGILTGWDEKNYGFMHLGFQEYLAAKEILRLAFNDAAVLRELAQKFGDPWWQEVGLLLVALEEPAFEPYMTEVVQQPAFAQHPSLVEMCLDDAAEKTAQPFLRLLKQDPGNDTELWERQLLALRIAERLAPEEVEKISEHLQKHPFDRIRQRFGKAVQDVIFAERGGYELVRIPGGVFMMGSPESEEGHYDDESPLHQVRVPEFYIGRYPVTNEEYGRFLSENHGVSEPRFWGDRSFNQPRQPVVGVSWDEAKRYAEWAGLRLPSEAEREYACRAGSQTRYYTGDKEEGLDRAGWYDKNSGSKLHPVGEKEPNAFGLYDMHGNVWEWVEDDWHDSYKEAPTDGSAWINTPRDSDRVLRGGSWFNGAWNCRVASRDYSPGNRNSNIGFRLCSSPKVSSPA
jgi:formylglycine-generating enzyme required for sulfatase activity